MNYSHNGLDFDSGKMKETFRHNSKEHLKITDVAK